MRRRRILRIAGAIVLAIALLLFLYAANVWLGLRAVPQTAGTISGLAVTQPVTILRDSRGVPHIDARNEHDAFFAQGFVEASDRLFQMDLTRRFVEGRLSEILGSKALASDESARTVPVDDLADLQWEHLPARLQGDLRAFSDGVNAAMRTQPLPPEFRILLYKPEPWRPQDALVTSFGIVLDLADLWTDVANRETPPQFYDRLHPLTDPCYDAPVTDGLNRISQSPRCSASVATLAMPPAAGSNEWAAGANHTTTGRALLANDPHLGLEIPGIWYLVDLRFPGYHAAGATFAGLPGVILGHNDDVAWGATNGTVASLSVFDAPRRLDPANWTTETFRVRLGAAVTKRYYRGAREFGAILPNGKFVLVRWDAYVNPTSQLQAFDGLDRARSIADALHSLRSYPGPTQNFVIADASGRTAYQLAGNVPDDPAWARSVHPAGDLSKTYAAVSFDSLPRVAPSRKAIVWTANNKMYGAGYPYRLSPEFAPPYRAYRIAQLLKARARYDVAYFTSMQMDTLSLPERDLVRRTLVGWPHTNAVAAELVRWDGRFTPTSRAATTAFYLRQSATGGNNQRLSAVMIVARRDRRLAERVPDALLDLTERWGTFGAVTVRHPLAALGLRFLNGTTFPGDGDNFTIHVQSRGFSQSFRAVWDVGNWDAGGISIPQGESGEPGSAHYTDEAQAWVAGRLLPLPYSKRAVQAAASERLILQP